MKEKPRQVLYLLPGEYYHPEAKYEEWYYDSAKNHLEWRGHWLHGKEHGLWEQYYFREDSPAILKGRRHFLHGELHGVWEDYWTDGTLESLEFWYEDKETRVFHTLFKAATGVPLPSFSSTGWTVYRITLK